LHISTILVSLPPEELIDLTKNDLLGITLLWARALAGKEKALAAEVSMANIRIPFRCISH
jgi:hypothetical protein